MKQRKIDQINNESIFYQRITQLVFLSVSLFIFCSCTSNPVGSNEVTGGKDTIAGQLVLSDSASPEGIIVWLEGFDIGTRTDAEGRFSITLPPPAAQSDPGGISGGFNLYYYMANYHLNGTKVATSRGEFIYDQGEINSNGELDSVKTLLKVIDIDISVAPASISDTYAGSLDVSILMKTAFQDCTSVLFPTSILYPHGAVLLRHKSSGQVYEFISNTAERSYSFPIGHKGFTKMMSFQKVQGALPIGNYEVVPFIRITHEVIPSGLLRHADLYFNEPSSEFFNMPIRWQAGELAVTQ